MKSNNALMRALPYAVTALLLVVCLLLPLLFRSEVEILPSATPAADSRARIYLSYASEELERHSLDSGEVETEALVACQQAINAVSTALIMDSGEVRAESSTGTNYYTVTDGDETIRVMEYYRGWTGDWSNWFIIQIDLDTREIYHCYYSAICMSNYSAYSGVVETRLGSALTQLPGELGFTACETEQTGAENWDVLLDRDGERVTYDCRSHLYEDSAPSLLLDLELTINSVSAA